MDHHRSRHYHCHTHRHHRSLILLTPATGATVASPMPVSYGFVRDDGVQSLPSPHSHAHVFLLIDQPAPTPGQLVVADAGHLAFPEGKNALSVPLAHGKHTLQLVMTGKAGKVGLHFVAKPAVSVTVP